MPPTDGWVNGPRQRGALLEKTVVLYRMRIYQAVRETSALVVFILVIMVALKY